jgi:hypothetical protein
VTATINISVKYGPGTTVYLCYRATEGVLEKIAIKKVKLIRGYTSDNYPLALYFDMNNFIYNEDELCTESEAIARAIDYYTHLIESIENKISQC